MLRNRSVVAKTSGFTLIELMIVVVVVGILASVAYPSYVEYVQKSRRGDAMASLADMRIAQEKWRANNTTYATTVTLPEYSATSKDSFYNMNIINVSAVGFTLTATPTGVQLGDACGVFALNQNGPDYTGAYADADCWER